MLRKIWCICSLTQLDLRVSMYTDWTTFFINCLRGGFPECFLFLFCFVLFCSLLLCWFRFFWAFVYRYTYTHINRLSDFFECFFTCVFYSNFQEVNFRTPLNTILTVFHQLLNKVIQFDQLKLRQMKRKKNEERKKLCSSTKTNFIHYISSYFSRSWLIQ